MAALAEAKKTADTRRPHQGCYAGKLLLTVHLRQRAPIIPIVVGLWSPSRSISESGGKERWGPTIAWRRFGSGLDLPRDAPAASEATELPVTPPLPAA